MLRHTDLARGASISLGVQGGGLALGYITQVLLARWLGESGFGTYSLVVAWATILGTVTALGWPDTLVRFIPTVDPRHRSGIIRIALVSALAAGLVAALVALLLRPSAQPLRNAFTIGVWMIPVLAASRLLSAVARTEGRAFLALAPNSILRPAITLVFVGISTLYINPTSSQAVVAVTLAVLIATSWQARSQNRIGANPQYDTRKWLRVAAPVWLFSVLGLATERSDLLIVGAFLPIEDVAAYGAAAATASVVLLFLIAAEVLAGPRFAAAGSREELQSLVRTTTRLGFWPALALVVIFVAFGESILGLFGEEFKRAYWVLVILGVGRAISAGAGSVVLVLNATGHQDENLKVFSVVATLSVAASLLVVPVYGMRGAAVVTSATLAAWNLWLHVIVRRRLGISTFPF